MSDSEDNPPAKRTKFDPDISENIIKNDTIQNVKHQNSKVKLEENLGSNKGKGENGKGCSNKYGYVSPEELQKLREFKVLDEVNEEDSKDEDSDSSDKSEELPDEEIEKMLDEDLPEDFKAAPKPKEKPYVSRQKIVLEEKGINQFEVLPLEWMMVRHCSGMPVYMHRPSRVCTLSKPYFLGKGNTRRHEIPISAIPCLSYRKALEEEEEQRKIDESIAEQIRNGTWATDERTDGGEDGKNTHEPAQKEIESTANAGEKTNENANESHGMEKAEKTNLTFEETPSVGEASSKVENKDDNRESSEKKESKNEGAADAEGAAVAEGAEGAEVAAVAEGAGGAEVAEVAAGAEVAEVAAGAEVAEACPRRARRPVVLPGGAVMPPPRVEEVNSSWKSQHLTPDQLNDYCKRLFKFKTVNIMHFKRWADRRRYTKARKALQYPSLPEGTKLITIPAQAGGAHDGRPAKRDWVMNMNGCSYLSVFHEYVRRALQKQPVYEFKQLENAATPYQATVYIGGMQYGSGRGSSKRQAKSAAARASIHILIPEMKDDLEAQLHSSSTQPDPDFSFFDYIGIEDPRVQEFSAAAAEPSPHAILRTCLLRNCGAGDRHIHTEMKKLEYQKIELTMKVGKHSATVVCNNKKQAKQTASQAILQALHPHIKSWGSLLRLYGSRSVKSCKERKLEEQQITLLQDKAQQNAPNYAVLEKLRHEMRKLKERDEAVVPIGTLLLAEGLPSHSGSNLNNVDL